jgi:hypothetical protein
MYIGNPRAMTKIYYKKYGHKANKLNRILRNILNIATAKYTNKN